MPSAKGQRFEKINWLKAGFLSADKLLTVSPNYADEIASDPEKGVELDDVIRCLPPLGFLHSHHPAFHFETKSTFSCVSTQPLGANEIYSGRLQNTLNCDCIVSAC